MRIVQLKRNRLFNIILCSTFVLSIVYITINFFSERPINSLKEYWAEGLKNKQVKTITI